MTMETDKMTASILFIRKNLYVTLKELCAVLFGGGVSILSKLLTINYLLTNNNCFL